MEHMDTAQMAEEQVSDAPIADAGNEASQQVNSTVVAETPTAEPEDQVEAAIEAVSQEATEMEETATDQVEGVTAETMSIVESEGEVAIIDETVSEAIDEYGNDVVVDETITDIIRADGSETIIDETITTAVDEAGDTLVIDEIVSSSMDDDGNLVVVDETVTELMDRDGNGALIDETVTDVIRPDGSETIVDETVTMAVDEAGDIAIEDDIVAAEIDADGDAVVVEASKAAVIDADGNTVMLEDSAQVYEIMNEETGEATMSTMADLVDDFEFKPLKSGETRDGIIVSISSSEILVDVGAKSEGFILQREMERHGREYVENYEVGDSVVVYVVRPEDRDGNVVLSLARAQQERDWREAERLQESGEVFESQVIGHNRGGVICRVGKVRGFVPASQLVSKPEVEPDTDEENRWAALVGENLWLKVVEMDRKRNRLILSERLASRERRRGRKDELMSELKKGDVRKGRISSLAKFGAFVDLGGADGLIHLSELSWSRVNHPSEVVSPGQVVEVYVLNVDRDRKRIGLSLRRLNPEPWSVVHEKYAVGQIVDGVITKLANFGAFARVDGSLEGLIHISELANHRVTHPREVVKEGEELKLRIVRIDPARKRMGLSLKRVEDEAYAEVDWRAEDIEDDSDETWADADDFND